MKKKLPSDRNSSFRKQKKGYIAGYIPLFYVLFIF